MYRALISFLLALVIMGGTANAEAEFHSGSEVRLRTPMAGDVFAAASLVEIAAPIGGDLFAVGFDVRLTGPTEGDAFLAGLTLDIDAPVAGDLLGAAFNVTIDAPVAGDVHVTGAEIVLKPDTTIAGDFTASAAEITLAGKVAGDAHLAGETVTIAGTVSGNLDVSAAELRLEPGARVIGNIRHSGPAAVTVPDGVTIGGTLEYRPQTEPADEGHGLADIAGLALMLFMFCLAVDRFLPRLAASSTLAIRAAPARRAVTGAALLLISPLVIFLLMVSVVGTLLGAMLLLVYLLALPMGLGMATLGLARPYREDSAAPLPRRMRRYAIAGTVIALLPLLPWIGWPLLLALAALGLGTVIRALRDERQAG